MTSLTILNSYSAKIISILAALKINLPFTNLEGILNNKQYTFGSMQDSGEHMIFKVGNFKL